MDFNTLKKCSFCKEDKNLNCYLSEFYDNKICKMCNFCREKMREYNNTLKCEEHGVRKSECKKCKGGHICNHNRIKSKCKECGDHIHLTIMRMLMSSKQSDKNKNRYNKEDFIDYCFLKNLIKKSNNSCFYCRRPIQFIHYADNCATIERLHNNIGHVKNNCVIACRSCNLRRVGNKFNTTTTTTTTITTTTTTTTTIT